MRARGPRFLPSTGSITAGAPPSTGFASGLDGALDFDGTSTVMIANGTIVPSAGVYTLPRDLMPTTLIVRAAARIRLGGWMIACTGAAAVDGIVDDDGNSASGITGGAARTAYRFTTGSAGGSSASGGASGSAPPGYTITAVGRTGTVNAPGSDGARWMGGSGGGYNNGTGGQGAGFSGGALTTNTITNGPGLDLACLLRGRNIITGAVYSFGSGGGAGALNVSGGGGGGAGGGCAAIVARSIAGSGRISARGGNGGNATVSGSGGGAGGGGGLVIIVAGSVASSLTIDAAGGSGGTGNGIGSAGGAGGAGEVSYFVP